MRKALFFGRHYLPDSIVIVDAHRRLTFAYVMNKMTPCRFVSPIAAAPIERVYDIVDR